MNDGTSHGMEISGCGLGGTVKIKEEAGDGIGGYVGRRWRLD